MKRFVIAAIGVLAALPAAASTGMAAVTEKDTLVVARIVSLLEGAPKGSVEVAVVTGNDAARADADSFLVLVGSGKKVGATTLTAITVTPETLSTTRSKIILIPAGTDAAHFDAIFEVARKKKLVTISTSDACLAVQRCAIAVKTDPAVDIKMSQAAAQATGVRFGSTLRMMIKEVP